MLLKCADIGHGAKRKNLHRIWSHRVLEEFLAQGDYEKELGMRISNGMDRELINVSSSQANFLTDMLMPLYEALVAQFSVCKPLVDQIYKNHSYWLRSGQTEDKAKTKPTTIQLS